MLWLACILSRARSVCERTSRLPNEKAAAPEAGGGRPHYLLNLGTERPPGVARRQDKYPADGYDDALPPRQPLAEKRDGPRLREGALGRTGRC